ncbi:DegT/DnrJ/EryC1/StrS family aminotransferase [Listeria booriae]|uniref:DegT/DnrJ/EryC1/StrS family aminotransferase n=1 Tax=Listeria booriae TaxID=1552123 RepID=UPI00162A1677|nr:aminotransferase class I/II-fold pyridoxal phosphate-dependent enzyme [Listeria booriae]MBC2324183.1 aminotransferase class I/II-fold pyridoxal phosphate-dependent enzyme [Listeria booriae]MCD2208044.1 aminotransferase class I/II-fold pyridoxal phosphate-dependent enzyme [Listeria booriae]
MDKIYLSAPHMGGMEMDYIQKAFDKNWIAPLGENVDMFEAAIMNYTEADYALALSSGTAAIHLALQTLGIGHGDDVFCSTLTFAATANPIAYVGANPVFIDSNEKTWNMCPNALKLALGDAAQKDRLPKAVVLVHILGLVAQMDEIMEICATYGVPLIEDAAESLGSTYNNQMTGTFGEMGIFSFNGNKIITTSGGGMLVSKQKEKREKAFYYATQAKEDVPYYLHKEVGFNYRLSNILAGIGIGQMKVIATHIENRRTIFSNYKKILAPMSGVSMMPILENTNPNCWLSAIRIDTTKITISTQEIVEKMAEKGIEARMMWNPLHKQPSFSRSKCYQITEQNVSEKLFKEVLCLPSGSGMTEVEQVYVIESLQIILEENTRK